MKYEWDPEKNKWLKENRNISFERVIFHLSRDDVWKIADHPDQERYPGQKIYFVKIESYIYLVPYVVEREHIFLKTITSSLKATKDYLKEEGGNEYEIR